MSTAPKVKNKFSVHNYRNVIFHLIFIISLPSDIYFQNTEIRSEKITFQVEDTM